MNGHRFSGFNIMSDQVDWQISSHLSNHWQEILYTIDQLGSADFSAKRDPFEFDSSTQAETKFAFPTFTMALPERAGGGLELILACRGNMTFDKAHFASTGSLRTIHFETESGYFRIKGDFEALKHVYGAHYDLETTRLGHPKFHAQMKSFYDDFGGAVTDHIGFALDIENCIAGILNTVRTPCAQMDVFSVILQAIADRLISQQPSDLETEAFERLMASSKHILGCGYMIPSLVNPPAPTCYRSPHWYL